jgi:hypothetical protein
VPEVISEPSRIPVPGGKVIDEYAGRVATRGGAVSVARMSAPGGWSEPGQTPEFDEVPLVLSGSVVVEHVRIVTGSGPTEPSVIRWGMRSPSSGIQTTSPSRRRRSGHPDHDQHRS